MFDGLKEMADALILANRALKKTADAALRANEEHDDRGETIDRLERLVMDQGAQHAADMHSVREELQAVREELRHLRNGTP
jgi:hypothetical protein